MTGERQTLDEAFQWQSEQYDTSFYEALEKTDYTVTADDGYINGKNPTVDELQGMLNY